jgi:hypothetical protein
MAGEDELNMVYKRATHDANAPLGVLETLTRSEPGFSPLNAYNLGRFYESKRKPAFMPVVQAGQLENWVETHDGRDPMKEYPWPRELINVFSWARKHAECKGIAAFRVVPTTAEQLACQRIGYNPFDLYGDDDAQEHLRAFIKKVGESIAQERLPPSQRRGPEDIRPLIDEERKKWGF